MSTSSGKEGDKVDILLVPNDSTPPILKTVPTIPTNNTDYDSKVRDHQLAQIPDIRDLWPPGVYRTRKIINIRYDPVDPNDEEDSKQHGSYFVILCTFPTKQGKPDEWFRSPAVFFRMEKKDGEGDTLSFRPTPKDEWAFDGEKGKDYLRFVAGNRDRTDFSTSKKDEALQGKAFV
ncbi:hypothetical protein ACLMJK_005611 [Lecanora helva]